MSEREDRLDESRFGRHLETFVRRGGRKDLRRMAEDIVEDIREGCFPVGDPDAWWRYEEHVRQEHGWGDDDVDELRALWADYRDGSALPGGQWSASWGEAREQEQL
jgi:hypothetical protein